MHPHETTDVLIGGLSTAAALQDGLTGDGQTKKTKSATPGIDAIVKSLRVRLGELVDLTVIEAAVTAELDRYSAAPIKQFIPILVERGVLERLGNRTR